MANMIKFYKGLEASLPAVGTNGALYITTDEGAIYLGTGTGMKRLGDFIQVANVASLPEKAHESCLYYCVAENILAKWNGTEWKQINKQPTAEEMKTLLGLGTMAYKSEVAEGDLNTELAAKINAASGAQHSHDNKDVIDGITAEKVTAWDASEQNAKDYADGLNTAMNTRVEALEAIDHEHANKDLLDTYTQTEADLADAVAKKHSHTFNETELNKIVEGDVAKWNGVVADHLTSADKTTLENAIKEAKKAGTDANTNIETYKVTNDARVLAVEEDIAEITGDNGILAQAKSYSDGKLDAAKTAISAEIDADVKVVADELAGYKTSNDTALAGVKATADAAAVKTEVETALAGKVDKVEGKSLIADSEITRLAGVTNYDDTQVKADIAKKADTETMTTELGKKVDKVEGYSLVSNTEIARLANVDNYDDTSITGRMTTAEGKITALETESAKHALKTEVEAVDAKFANYNTTEAQKAIDDAQDAKIKAISDDYVKTADIANFETKENVKKVADDLAAYVESNNAAVADRYTKGEADAKFALIADAYDDEEVRGLISDNADAIAAEESRAKGVEESLQTQINTIMNNPDAEGAINSINEFTQYVKDHGSIAEGMRTDINKNKEDIAANAKAIEDEVSRADTAEKALAGRIKDLEDNKAGYATTGEVATAKQEAITKAGELDAALKTEIVTELDKKLDSKDPESEEVLKWAACPVTKERGLQLVDTQYNDDGSCYMNCTTYTDNGVYAHAIYTNMPDGNGDYTDIEYNVCYGAGGITVDGENIAFPKTSGTFALAENLYTKTEVEAAIATAVEAAHTWGEF